MAQEVLNYEVNIDFGGGAAPVDVTMADPPGGPYEVEILDSRQVTKDEGGKTSLRVNVAIVEEGPAKGLTTMVVMGTDYSKPFNVGHMANLLLGAGVPADKLKGQVKVRPEILKGRHAFIFVRAPMEGETLDDGRPARANKNFVTKAQYEQAKKAQSLATGGSAPVTRGAPAAAAPANGAPSTPPAASGGSDLAGLFPT